MDGICVPVWRGSETHVVIPKDVVSASQHSVGTFLGRP